MDFRPDCTKKYDKILAVPDCASAACGWSFFSGWRMIGQRIDASMLGGEYAVILKADGAVDFVFAGAEIPGMTWSPSAGGFRIDYFGTTMEGAVIATGVDINYFDTLSLSNAISCLAGGRSLSFAFYNFIVIASKPVDTLNDKGIAFFSFRMSF